MFKMPRSQACHRVSSQQVSSRWGAQRILQTLQRRVSTPVAISVVVLSGILSYSATAGYNSGRGGGFVGDARSQVRYLPHERSRQTRLASGSLSQNGEKQGYVVRVVQPGYRLPERRSPINTGSDYISLDAFCMSLNVFFEARDQPLAGQVAVAQITMNRVHSPDYPDTVCEVVNQYKQFSWYWDGKSDVPREEDAWNRAQMVAQGVLAGSGHADLMDVSITHYHAAVVSPYWITDMQFIAQIGGHLIYSTGVVYE